MSYLQINLLGTFEVLGHDRQPVHFPTRKAKVLVAYLARRDDLSASRDALVGLLWGSAVRDKRAAV